MQIGIHIHLHGLYSEPQRCLELARAAEAAGWDGVFVTDHLIAPSHSRPSPVANPWIILAAIASQTQRVRLGPIVTPLPRRRPWQLAGEAVTLDHLSAGRLILGLGSGAGIAENFAPYGEERALKTRAAMLDEGLATLTALWSGQRVDQSGAYYRLVEAIGLPAPVQSPRIPIWIAASWPAHRPFQRASRWDGVFIDVEGVDWLNAELIRPADLAAAIAYLTEQRQAAGTAAGPYDIAIGGHLPDDRQRAADALAAYQSLGLTWWVEGIHPAFGSADNLLARVRQGPPRPPIASPEH